MADDDRLTQIKARRVLLADWHETYQGVTEQAAERAAWLHEPAATSDLQRCRRCGASSLDYPECEIEHDPACPVPAAMAAHAADDAWLIAEVDDLNAALQRATQMLADQDRDD